MVLFQRKGEMDSMVVKRKGDGKCYSRKRDMVSVIPEKGADG